MFHNKVKRYINQEELSERFYSIAYRVTKDVLDLPPQVHSRRFCELGPAARKVYDQMAKDMVAQVKGGTVTAQNALVKLLRLQQVASGYAPADGSDPVEERIVEVGTEKRDLLAETLADFPTDKPIVVFAVFKKDLENVRLVCEAQGRRYKELSGRDKSGLTEDAKMAEDADVVGIQEKSGGVGVDMTRADVAIHYSTGPSLITYEQKLSRIHRPGQTQTVQHIHLLVEDTYDVRNLKLLQAKKDVVSAVLGDIENSVFGGEEDGSD